MKIRQLKLDGTNTGKLKPAFTKSCHKKCDFVTIRKGMFKRGDYVSALQREKGNKYYYRLYHLAYNRKIVYCFYEFSNKKDISRIYLGFNKWQHQCFLWMQGDHWLQQESNLRYVVNVIFLIIGAYLGVKGLV